MYTNIKSEGEVQAKTVFYRSHTPKITHICFTNMRTAVII